MSDKHSHFEIALGLSMFTQIAISVATPLILCIAGAAYLRAKFELGLWVVIVGIALGLYLAYVSMYQLFRYYSKRAEKSTEDTLSSNRR